MGDRRPVDPDDEFAAFFADLEPRLRRVLVAQFGVDRGREAAADTLSWAWEHWPLVKAVDNPGGYLYRVAVRRRGRRPRRSVVLPTEPTHDFIPEVEPRLHLVLATLTERQRVAVLLVYGWGWPQVEAARMLGISESSLRTHLARGMQRLRSQLEVHADVKP